MSDDPSASAPFDDGDLGFERPAREPIMTQAEIDAAGGWTSPDGSAGPSGGVRAMVGAGAGPREKLPMFAVVFDTVVERLTHTFRKLFGTEVDLSLADLSPVRYGDFIEDLTLPAQVAVFKAEGWDGEGLVAMGPRFASLVLDTMLGAGPSAPSGAVAARPFSAIETALLTRLADAVLLDAEAGFGVLGSVAFRRTRVEGDPRLANLARPGDVALAARLALAVDGRAAEIVLLLPYATLEPIKDQLRESFMRVKLGRDDYWSGHLATEIWQAPMRAEAVLHETALPLGRVLDLAVGDTLMFDMTPTDLIEIRAEGRTLTRGRLGRVDGRIAVKITEPLRAFPAMGSESS